MYYVEKMRTKLSTKKKLANINNRLNFDANIKKELDVERFHILKRFYPTMETSYREFHWWAPTGLMVWSSIPEESSKLRLPLKKSSF